MPGRGVMAQRGIQMLWIGRAKAAVPTVGTAVRSVDQVFGVVRSRRLEAHDKDAQMRDGAPCGCCGNTRHARVRGRWRCGGLTGCGQCVLDEA